MPDDAELLRRYADSGSEAAFAELVRRHLKLVYSVALRRMGGDTHRAQDVSQKVFIDLARKAGDLSGRPVLVGWLYRSAQFAARDLMRSEWRRQAREREAQALLDLSADNGVAVDWNALHPVLDKAMGVLTESDRDAVLLRFAEERPFAQIGAALHITEDAARMRVDRALEKMRVVLARRGLTSTTAALAAALVNEASMAAPAGLASVVTGAALSGAASGGAFGLFTTIMTATKLNTAIVGGLILAGSAGVYLQQRSIENFRGDIANLSQQDQEAGSLSEENLHLRRTAAEIADLRAAAAQLPQAKMAATDAEESLKEAIRRRREKAAHLTAAYLQNGAVVTIGSPVTQPGQGFQPPTLIASPSPQFPFEMRRAGISGRVLVDVVVDANGNVQSAHAAESTQGEFEAGAIAAVSQWKFTPGQVKGQPVMVNLHIPVNFVLSPTPENNWP